jgi:dihydrofolate reductase
MKTLEIVVAMDADRGIGRGGSLPWHIPADLKRFKAVTTAAPLGQHNAVIMGRKTWESLPDKFRPLPGRQNIVLSLQPSYPVPEGVWLAASLSLALTRAQSDPQIASIFVIGGADVIRQAMAMPACTKIHLTQVLGKADCDVFLPDFLAAFVRTACQPQQSENNWVFCFETWERRA